MNRATKAITDILSACGCQPGVTQNGEIKVNAPEIKSAKSCDTCAKRGTCTKQIGIIFGFCNVDYERASNE
jgi:hypothetical protein